MAARAAPNVYLALYSQISCLNGVQPIETRRTLRALIWEIGFSQRFWAERGFDLSAGDIQAFPLDVTSGREVVTE